MKFYMSKGYQQMTNAGSQTAYNTFYMLSDKERFNLHEKIEQLERDINDKLEDGYFTVAYTKAGKMRNTTKSIYEICKKDLEAIDFLKRMTWFCTYEESVALDPTAYQIETIVNKLLFKVYRTKPFIHWMELYLSDEEVTPTDMRNWMSRKRGIFKALQEEGLISQDKVLPY